MFLVTVASSEAAFAQNNSLNELPKMFDYDQKLPLDVKEVGCAAIAVPSSSLYQLRLSQLVRPPELNRWVARDCPQIPGNHRSNAQIQPAVC